MKVEIDGIEYVPRNTVISDRVMKVLNKLYGKMYIEGYYDPTNDERRKMAKEIFVKLDFLNRELKFKE